MYIRVSPHSTLVCRFSQRRPSTGSGEARRWRNWTALMRRCNPINRAISLGAYAGFVCDAKGRLLLAWGRFAEALEAFERALGNNFPETLDGYGRALLAMERYDEAAKAFERELLHLPQAMGERGSIWDK